MAWLLADRLGSIRDIVDDTGTVIDHRDYDAWGNLTSETNPARGDQLGYAGYFYDATVGQYQVWHRWHDATTNRWTQEDPTGFAAGDSDLYRYVGNDATNATDPTGLMGTSLNSSEGMALIGETAGAGGGGMVLAAPAVAPVPMAMSGMVGVAGSTPVWTAPMVMGTGAVTAGGGAAIGGGVSVVTAGGGAVIGGGVVTAGAGSGAVALGGSAITTGGVGAGLTATGFGTAGLTATGVGGSVVTTAGIGTGVATGTGVLANIVPAFGIGVTAGGLQCLLSSPSNSGYDQGQGYSSILGPPQQSQNTAGACFVANTPILTPGGMKFIQDLRVGDKILSRSESDAEGPVEAREVQEVFATFAGVFEIRVGGRSIRTTAEHPFWVRGRGWADAREIGVGDSLLSADGRWLAVESALDTGEREAVYNVRIAEYHTYFVGGDEWGFAVWAHNACQGYRVMDQAEIAGAVLGIWTDSVLVAGDQSEEGSKWLWTTQTEAQNWRTFLASQGETGLSIALVPTANDISTYPQFPHPPQGTAVQVPIPDLGSAIIVSP